MAAIYASGLTKTYPGEIPALVDLDLTVEQGAVFGLLGPNGAGKTTTVRLLNGTLDATRGVAEVLGQPASTVATKERTATLAEMAKMYEHLSVVQNLEFFADMYGVTSRKTRDHIDELVVRMGLKGRENDKLGTFSTGMKKRAQLARTLLHGPELIFLDEPTSGLDPDAARQVTELIRNLAQEEGTTVILCTHNLPVAEKVCDMFGFLSEGKLVASGTKEELTAHVSEKISLEVVTKAGTENVTISGEEEINHVLRRIMDAGGQIREVRVNDQDLESLYFKYVGRSDHELG